MEKLDLARMNTDVQYRFG
ncbi:unnamed protein product, partial [Rotaria sp. Silwood1]